jgi:hypothetical protein
MEFELGVAIVIAMIPFLGVGGLMWASQRIERRRTERIACQIMLTDAIHRELGAAAAPVVRQTRQDGWIVSMAVPIGSDAIVAALVRITHRFFSERDGVDTPRLRIVLMPRARRVARQAGTIPMPRRIAGKLSSAA